MQLRTQTPPRPVRGWALTLALSTLGSTMLAAVAAGPATAAGPLERVVVTHAGAADAGAGAADAVARAVEAAGGSVLRRLPVVGGVSAQLPRGAALAPSYAVVPDRALSLATTGAPTPGPASTVRATLGLGAPAGEGAGTVVAVVDTGVADVPDLAGRLSHVDVTGTGGTVRDGYGHGTFVAGLVAADGSTSGGRYAGVAPGAQVLDVRVATADGTTDLVTVLAGLQAVSDAGNVDVVNLSLASGSPLPYQLDPLAMALDALWREGTTVVVPAGNDGDTGGRVGAPGNDPLLLTVGGLDESGTASRRDDTVAAWSSHGPAAQGIAKPELVAPGASLVSLRAPGSAVDLAHPTSRVGDGHVVGSGTSFSTAVASGAAAVLLAERELTPDQVKVVLTRSAYGTRGLRAGAGAGGLDLARALDERAPRVDRAGRKNSTAAQEPVPGDPQLWAAFLQALTDGDPEAAASSWAAMPRDVQRWVDRTWAGLSPEARAWAGRNWAAGSWAAGSWAAGSWAGGSWAGGSWAGATADQWAAREWAARAWAGRSWAAGSWAGRNGAAGSWAGRNWADAEWATVNWAQLVELELDAADGVFPALDWVGDDWAGRNWVGDDWAGRNWGGRNWAGRNWGGRNWGGRNWAASAWAASAWAGWDPAGQGGAVGQAAVGFTVDTSTVDTSTVDTSTVDASAASTYTDGWSDDGWS